MTGDQRSGKGPGGLTGLEAVVAVAEGRVTVAALHRDAIDRAGRWEPALGAIVDPIDCSPMVAAGTLTGMVLGIKSLIAVGGFPDWHSYQSGEYPPSPAEANAPVVGRLLAAGAVLAGTTAAPLLGAPGGLTPQTMNPRSSALVSGGSSGGSAAAIAAGLVHGALGTDAGGSIRIPAACCGVVGLHTTRGLVPLTGVAAATYSMDAVGPMAATVADTRALLDVIVGPDGVDPHATAAPPMKRAEGPLRIGIPAEQLASNIDAEVRAAFEGVVEILRDSHASVDVVSIPMIDESMELGPWTIGIVESVAGMEDAFGEGVMELPGFPAAVEAASRVPATRLARAYHRVALLRAALREVFEGVDVLVSPTLPCRIPLFEGSDREADIEVGGVVEERTAALTRFVNPWNLAAVPAGSVPIARDSRGGPISLQVIGPWFSKHLVLDVMEQVEKALGGPWAQEGRPPVRD